MAALEIFALDVAQGQLAISACPGQGTDYELDLEAIAAWRPAFVLSMTPLDELEKLGVPRLPADVPTLGARWLHFPISDFGAPDADQMQVWVQIAGKIKTVLNGGGRVLIHCRGGCGRSGMAALRLMVELGEEVSGALARLRFVRHCAVETDPQFDWAAAGATQDIS